METNTNNQPFTIQYDSNIVDVTALESDIQAAERALRIEQVKHTGRAVLDVIATRMQYAAINTGQLLMQLASEARDEFGR